MSAHFYLEEDGDLYIRASGLSHITQTSADDSGTTLLNQYRAKGSLGSEATVSTGTTVGMYRWFAHDGGDYRAVGYIACLTSGVSGSDIGGKIQFALHEYTVDSTGVATVKMQLEDDGQLQVSDGTGTNPAYSFINDPDTGVGGYGVANKLYLICGGFTMQTLDYTTQTIDILGLVNLNGYDLLGTGYQQLVEQSSTPSSPSDGIQAHIYMKADKFVIQYNDGGTVRYKYLDLTGTGVTWVHSTSAP